MTIPVETAVDPAARIGPNAVIRVAEVLHERFGPTVANDVFAAAGIAHHWAAPPQQMVDEREVADLHRHLHARFGIVEARKIGHEAGLRTADYLLAHRIPRLVQYLLHALPAAWAARALLATISRHAWTFAGSGVFRVSFAGPIQLAITGNPLCRALRAEQAVCDYYTATFERLFRALVHDATNVMERSCEANGAARCVFEVRWP